MEVIILISILFLVFLFFDFKKNVDGKLQELNKNIDFLKRKIDKLSEEAKLNYSKEHPTKEEKEVIQPKLPEPIPSPINIITPVLKEEPKEPKPLSQPVSRPAVPKTPPVRKPTFFERNPDLEKFIGENLINKIGIAILVIGIGFFVKFAIDQNWIKEGGRVAIGILCGGILIGFAHKIRTTFKPFSSVLVGGGLAVFYLTIAIAFHDYAIFSQPVAFIIMVVITCFAILLSILYNRMELAVLAIIGGFASPFMVSKGDGNYQILFTYILILNLGMLLLAYFKKWNLINIISYAFTIILFGGWLISKYSSLDNPPYMGAFLFATTYYLVFFLMNIINNIKENRKFIVTEISILISNTFLYYTAGSYILDGLNDGLYKGLFTTLIAAFNFGFAYTLYRNKKVDSNLVYLLIGIVLTFLSLAAPVQLEGNQITLFWAAEAVLLLWLSQKSGIQLIKIGAVIVMALMNISLLMDWVKIYSYNKDLLILWNKGFMTSLTSIVSIFLTRRLLNNEKEEILFSFLNKAGYKVWLEFSLTVFTYISVLLELNHQLHVYLSTESLISVIIGSYNLLFCVILMFILSKQKTITHQSISVALGFLSTLSFILHYHSQIISLRYDYLTNQYISIGGFLYHWILIALTGTILFLCLKSIKALSGIKSVVGKVFLWYSSFAIIFIASAELDHIVLLIGYSTPESTYSIIHQNQKIGYPIIWGICAFVLIVVGMQKKIKELRIISLTIFSVILLKLFLFDIRGISEGGKIAAFICLGVLLLIISFMYQKLKKLLIEDEPRLSNN